MKRQVPRRHADPVKPNVEAPSCQVAIEPSEKRMRRIEALRIERTGRIGRIEIIAPGVGEKELGRTGSLRRCRPIDLFDRRHFAVLRTTPVVIDPSDRFSALRANRRHNTATSRTATDATRPILAAIRDDYTPVDAVVVVQHTPTAKAPPSAQGQKGLGTKHGTIRFVEASARRVLPTTSRTVKQGGISEP